MCPITAEVGLPLPLVNIIMEKSRLRARRFSRRSIRGARLITAPETSESERSYLKEEQHYTLINDSGGRQDKSLNLGPNAICVHGSINDLEVPPQETVRETT